jgi:hypothetical protein
MAGQLAGIALQLNADALEKYIETAPAGFKYGDLCRLTISFVRSIRNQT